MPSDITQFGVAGALVVVVFMFLKFIREAESKRDITYEKVAQALGQLKDATKQNTSATKSADEYLRQRNGRDNEHHEEVLKSLQVIPKTMRKIANDQSAAIISAYGEQKIEHQVVAHQTVDERVDHTKRRKMSKKEVS